MGATGSVLSGATPRNLSLSKSDMVLEKEYSTSYSRQGSLTSSSGNGSGSATSSIPTCPLISLKPGFDPTAVQVLQQILESGVQAPLLRQYIEASYKDDIMKSVGDKVQEAERLRDLALATFDFWCDASDFELFTSDTMKILRGEDIARKYLKLGEAPPERKVPFGRVLVESTMVKLDAERVPPFTVFLPAKAVAYEYLETEVYPYYRKNRGPLGYDAAQNKAREQPAPPAYRRPSMELAVRLVDLFQDGARTRIFKDFLANRCAGTGDLVDFYLELCDIKDMAPKIREDGKEQEEGRASDGDSKHTSSAKSSCLSGSSTAVPSAANRDSPRNASTPTLTSGTSTSSVSSSDDFNRGNFAVSPREPKLPALSIAKVMGVAPAAVQGGQTALPVVNSGRKHDPKGAAQSLGSPCTLGPADLARSLVFTRLNRLYDRCLRVGSLPRVLFTEDQILSMVDRLLSTDKLISHDFEPLIETVGMVLSDAFIDFVENKTVLYKLQKLEDLRDAKTKYYTKVLTERDQRLSRVDAAIGRALDEDMKPALPVDSPGRKQRDTSLRGTEEDRRGLAELLHSKERIASFVKHLDKVGLMNLLAFWNECEEFRNIPLTQMTYLQARAEKIYDKFLRQGSNREVGINNPSVRTKILSSLACPTHHLFDKLQTLVFDDLVPEYAVWQLSQQGAEVPVEISDLDIYGSSNEGCGGEPSPTSNNSLGWPCDVELPTPIDFDQILGNSTYSVYFKKFCEAEFFLGPFMLWYDIQEAKRLPRSGLMETRYRKIFNKYMRESNSPNSRVSLSAQALAQAMERMSNPGPLTFQMAEAEVYATLKSIMLPKFLRSEECLKLAQAIRQDSQVVRQSSTKEDFSPLDASTTASTTEDKPEANRSTTPGAKRAKSTNSLKALLKSPSACKVFFTFCITCHSEENILFWTECEDFKTIPGSDFLRLQARKIAARYVQPGARLQVNVSSAVRDELLGQLDHPTRSLFVRAQDEILCVMERDVYPRFRESPHYEAYLAATGAMPAVPSNGSRPSSRASSRGDDVNDGLDDAAQRSSWGDIMPSLTSKLASYTPRLSPRRRTS